MRLATFIVALAAFPTLTEAAATHRARYLMGTVCEVAIEGSARAEADIEAAFTEVARIESMLSTWTADSELARVNRGERQASAELRALLDTTLAWSKRTAGAFDPQIRHLIVREGSPRPPGGGFEEGAFGKGYAIDRMLSKIDAPHALVNFGGQIAVRGSERVTIAAPADRQKPAVAFTLLDASLSTSSSSEQAHIFDPRTGQLLPARGSVSVVTPTALAADILSTALYVLGEDDGLRWANTNGIAAIFITPNGTIRMSSTAREQLRDFEILDRHFNLKD